MIGRAVVTGGAGFIGSHLVTRLVDEGAEVLVIDDLSTGRLERLAEARRTRLVQIHQLDVRAQELGQALLRFRPEVVFHLAANASVARSVADPVHDTSVNVLGTVNALQAAEGAGAGRFVFASSAAVYGDPTTVPLTERSKRRPLSPYGLGKHAAEGYVKLFGEQYGLDYNVVIPANVYGPGQDTEGEAGVVAIFAKALTSGRRPEIHGDGSQTRDFVYVEDIADALVRAGTRGGGRVLNAGTGTETSIGDLYAMLARITGVGGQPRRGPERPGDIARSALDPSAAARHLGWEPFTSLEAGLRRTVRWLTG